MGFRIVIISTHSKLEYSLNYLVYRTVDECKRINLDEINTLIIQSTAVSITTSLLQELVNKKIKVIFCDEKNNPSSELVPYYGDSITSRRVLEQINWNQDIKGKVWKEIVIQKIRNQAYVLDKNHLDSYQLRALSDQVENDDITNREGHAAKVYFNRVFGDGFTRNDNCDINIFLNYGYTILLSQFNRSIVAKGYITQIGIHHKNDFNEFNLSCDLIEPFRPIVDAKALLITKNNYKEELIKLLTNTVVINGQKQTLANAINIYVASVFRALNTNSLEELEFFTSYEL